MCCSKILSKQAGVEFPIGRASSCKPLAFQFKGQSSCNRLGASEMCSLERSEHKVHEKVTENIDGNNLSFQMYLFFSW